MTPKNVVLYVTILETTKTNDEYTEYMHEFYRSQFWRLQKQAITERAMKTSFIGHNFGDYKNR